MSSTLIGAGTVRAARRTRTAAFGAALGAALTVLAVLALASPGSARAATGPALIGHWTFDEGTGTIAADSSGTGHPLTLANGASWGAGAVGPHALAVNGAAEYAASAGPVIDTTQSFSVSAWVNVTNTNGFQTFVSQDGSQVSGFYLQLRGDTHRFAFTHLAFDSPSALGTIATASSIIPQPGQWYLLTGVYDAAQSTISLYVNGALAQTQSFSGSWSASGPLAVGRGRYAGNPTDYVSGRIDDARAYSGALSPTAIRQLAGSPTLAVDAAQPGPAINPTQFGSFLEEINHSADGGLYAELIRNRDLKEDPSTPVSWSAVADHGASTGMALDRSQPLNSANPVSLKLSVSSLPAGGRAGVANAGYFGIPIRPSTTYRVSFFAKSSQAGSGPLTVDLESTRGDVWASATVAALSTNWAKYTATLTTGAKVPTSLSDRFVISTASPSAAGSTLWFTIVSLFPPTYDNLSNGFRPDLMDLLAGLHPGYFRVPGGNALEGNTIDTRFEWSNTIGPIENRSGHDDSAWGYWSQDGMGLLEYLELAQETGAKPLLAVWAGYTLNGTAVPESQLAPYVQDAVNEIHYAVDPTSTPWGARRAADGHPAPFSLMGVEIGNEDFFDNSGSYNAYRYPMFYDAIKSAFPGMPIVATAAVTSRPMDILDEHFYNNDPNYFASNAHLFDAAARTGPKVLVGEYAATLGQPTGTLAAALGESAFLTGLERNADLVLGASYAPLLVNVNVPNWPTNLIGYDGLSSYGSPSYWAQTMLVNGHGDHVIGSQVQGGTGTLFEVASAGPGHTYVVVVNNGSDAAPTTVTLHGLQSGASGGTATVLTGAPGAMNSLTSPTAVAPTMKSLGGLGTSFRYTFAPNSVTVLNLSTPAATAAPRGTKRSLAAPATTSAAAIQQRAIRSGAASRRTARAPRLHTQR